MRHGIEFPRPEGKTNKASRDSPNKSPLVEGVDGAFGLCLYGVSQPARSKLLAHGTRVHPPKRHGHPWTGTRRLNGCLILLASPEINASVLSLILDQMFYSEPSGTFSMDLLFEVLDDVEKS